MIVDGVSVKIVFQSEIDGGAADGIHRHFDRRQCDIEVFDVADVVGADQGDLSGDGDAAPGEPAVDLGGEEIVAAPQRIGEIAVAPE